jgi:hypothetical protein
VITSHRVRPGIQHLLDSMTDAAAYVRNGRLDIVAANRLGRALYAPVFEDPARPVDLARFRFFNPRARDFSPDWDESAHTPAHGFLAMLDPAGGPAPGDPARMAARIIDSVETEPVPLCMVLGSQALENTPAALRTRIAGFEKQSEPAASNDFPPGQ